MVRTGKWYWLEYNSGASDNRGWWAFETREYSVTLIPCDTQANMENSEPYTKAYKGPFVPHITHYDGSRDGEVYGKPRKDLAGAKYLAMVLLDRLYTKSIRFVDRALEELGR